MLLYWLQAREHEIEQFNEQRIEKGKVMKIPKYLNGLVLVSGLKSATGARVAQGWNQTSECSNYLQKFVYLIVIMAVVMGGCWIWRRLRVLEDEIARRRMNWMSKYRTTSMQLESGTRRGLCLQGRLCGRALYAES